MPKTINPSALTRVQWPAQHCLAFSTTVHHPLSAAQPMDSVYGAFNLALHVGDEPALVMTHRQTLQTFLPGSCQIQWLNQVHGDQVVEIKQVSHQPLTADAQITREKHIALAIMTADCLPILLAAKDGSEIAAIHGGWRPLAQAIIANTLSKMATNARELVAWLGPCIGPAAFEVGAEVKARFCTIQPELACAFTESRSGHYFADLALIAKMQLAQAGITSIDHFNHCTFSNSHQYYSYRRQATTGRMVTVICRS